MNSYFGYLYFRIHLPNLFRNACLFPFENLEIWNNMTLTEIISQLDIADKPFTFFDFSVQINQCKPKSEDRNALIAESFAARFVGNINDNSGKQYYHPMITYADQNGNIIENPNKDEITPEMVTYWEKRVEKSINPLFRAQYAGLVWEFKFMVSQEKPNIKFARMHIDSLSEVVEKKLYDHEVVGTKYSERAIVLAKQLKYEEGLERAKIALSTLAGSCKKDEYIGIWGVPYRICCEHKGIYSEKDIRLMISDMESRFNRIALENKDPWLLLDIAELLAAYYKRNGKQDAIEPLFVKVVDSFESKSTNLSRMQLISNYERLINVVDSFGLKKMEADLSLKIETLGENIHDEMHTISHEFSIDKKDIDQHNDFLLGGGMEEAFKRFIFYYVPKREEAEKSVKELAKNAPFLFMISTHLYGNNGRVMNTVGGIENDLDGQIILHISKSMKISSLFIDAVIEEGKKCGIFSIETVTDFIFQSPVYSSERRKIIEKGLEAYYNDDFVVAIHLLIPQLEEAIRQLCKLSGVVVLRRKDNGKGFTVRILDDMLRDSQAVNVLSEDLANYLRILLTDDRGWNLRNDICHGIASPNLFNKVTADRILHAILCLGSFRYQNLGS